MSKTKEELNALKKELEDLNEKCRELTEEEMEQVTGGASHNEKLFGKKVEEQQLNAKEDFLRKLQKTYE